jgi:hypothetical protein
MIGRYRDRSWAYAGWRYVAFDELRGRDDASEVDSTVASKATYQRVFIQPPPEAGDLFSPCVART